MRNHEQLRQGPLVQGQQQAKRQRHQGEQLFKHQLVRASVTKCWEKPTYLKFS